MALLCGLSLLWTSWKLPAAPQAHCTELTPDSNQCCSVLAKQAVNCTLPVAFYKKKDAGPFLRHSCLLLFLPSAQSHCARVHAGFSCLSYRGLNLPLFLIQVLNDQGGSRGRSQGDTHQAHGTGTSVTPGVTSCWWRQEGVRELLGLVLALEQPSELSCF